MANHNKDLKKEITDPEYRNFTPHIQHCRETATTLKASKNHQDNLLSNVYMMMVEDMRKAQKLHNSRYQMSNDEVFSLVAKHWKVKAQRVADLPANMVVVKRFYNRVQQIYLTAANDLFINHSAWNSEEMY